MGYKVGDLVALDIVAYPQYRGQTALLLTKQQLNSGWQIMVGTKVHPFSVSEESFRPPGQS